MMSHQSYLNKCKELLTEFEKIQLKMLQLDLPQAGDDFMDHIKQMHQFFKQCSIDFGGYSFKSEKDKLLLTKQIERLLIFLKEMDLHITGFQAAHFPEENEILFVFERQHLFKNIYRKHMDDFSRIMV
jgi:hypothetical protein